MCARLWIVKAVRILTCVGSLHSAQVCINLDKASVKLKPENLIYVNLLFGTIYNQIWIKNLNMLLIIITFNIIVNCVFVMFFIV